MFSADLASEHAGPVAAMLRRHKYVDIQTGESARPGLVRVVARYDPTAKGTGKAPGRLGAYDPFPIRVAKTAALAPGVVLLSREDSPKHEPGPMHKQWLPGGRFAKGHYARLETVRWSVRGVTGENLVLRRAIGAIRIVPLADDLARFEYEAAPTPREGDAPASPIPQPVPKVHTMEASKRTTRTPRRQASKPAPVSSEPQGGAAPAPGSRPVAFAVEPWGTRGIVVRGATTGVTEAIRAAIPKASVQERGEGLVLSARHADAVRAVLDSLTQSEAA